MRHQTFHAITPAGPGDAADLARVHVQAWRETYPGLLPKAYLDALSVSRHASLWRRRLLSTDEVTLAAENETSLVGYASGGPARGGGANRAEITTLYVLREAQGAGLGRRLLGASARVLAARGATSLIIWVLRDNRAARGFYAHLGGRLAGERAESVGGRTIPAVAYGWNDLSGGFEL